MRRWRTLHQWFGLGAGVFLFVTAGTGGMLLLGDILEAPAPELPEELVDDPIGAEEIIRIAERESKRAVTGLGVCRGPRQMWSVELDNGDELFLSPAGTVVARRELPVYTGVLSLALKLHTGGIARKPGHTFMLLVSASLLGSLATGVLIWPWLRRRTKKR